MQRLRRRRSWIRVAAIVQWLFIRWQVGIDQSRQLLRHNLRSLHLILDRRGHGAFFCLARGKVLIVLGREAWLRRRNHHDFVQAIQRRCWLQDDVDKSIAVGIAHHFLNHSDGQPARKDHVATSRQHMLARLNALIAQDAHDLQSARSVTAKNAANARRLQNHSRAAGGVIDCQHLRGVRKDIAHLAHNALCRNHCHIRLQAVAPALVDIEIVRAVAAAGAINLRGHGRINVFLLESKHRLQPLALARILEQCGLFQSHPVDSLFEILVLLAHMHQIHVVGPREVHSHFA